MDGLLLWGGYAVLAAAWLAAIPKDFRGKTWHYAHIGAIGIVLAAQQFAPAPLRPLLDLFLACGGVILAIGAAVWAIGTLIRNHSIMDIAYPGLVVAVAAYALTQSASGLSPHALALFALPAIWGARLMSHATGTNLKVEQEPYANLRRRYGERWTIWSFFAVYALQGSILWLWCAPIIVGMSVQSAAFTLWDALGVAVWLTGFAFQSIGDHQLKMFKRDSANKGKLMQSGLWSRTRHPNYFGECLMWTGYVFFALTYPWGWTTILSAIYVTWFMGWGSAAPGNERHMRKTRPEYEAYAKRVPRLFPRLWPNKEQRA